MFQLTSQLSVVTLLTISMLWVNTAYCVELNGEESSCYSNINGEDLSRYSNKIESVVLRNCPRYQIHCLTKKVMTQ